MSLSFSRSAILASALALSVTASAASATTVSLTYNGATAADARNVTVTNAPVAYPGTGNWPKTVGAYGFNMTDSSGTLGSFVAWCLDLGNFLAETGAQTYTITADSFGLDALQEARVQKVFDANYTSLDLAVGDEVAGFQLALWDALYDGDWNLATGLFTATASTAIAGFAATYLDGAKTYAGVNLFDMTFLQSTGNPQFQNLVTVKPVAPVPLPAGGLLLLGALGGLGMAVRRRRKSA